MRFAKTWTPWGERYITLQFTGLFPGISATMGNYEGFYASLELFGLRFETGLSFLF